MNINLLNKSNLKTAHELGQNFYERRDFNCWGATLFLLDKCNELLWIEQDEMINFLDDKTKVINNEIKIGDILVIYHCFEGLLHTAVYIGKDIFWHKRGSGKSKFSKKEEILEEYSKDGEISYKINRLLNI